MWGWTGMWLPMNVTSGESKGYLAPNLNCSWKFSPSYKVPGGPRRPTFHLKWLGGQTVTTTAGQINLQGQVLPFQSLLIHFYPFRGIPGHRHQLFLQSPLRQKERKKFSTQKPWVRQKNSWNLTYIFDLLTSHLGLSNSLQLSIFLLDLPRLENDRFANMVASARLRKPNRSDLQRLRENNVIFPT